MLTKALNAMIAIIDYDMGNLRSVEKALERVGAEAAVTRNPKTIEDASHIVLPGVGAFGECMKNLEAYDLIDTIIKAIESGKPFLGICLGLQLLFEESMEAGAGGKMPKGLGVIKGKVRRFPEPILGKPGALKVPHMGWNDIKIMKDSSVLADVPDGSYFYFVHSYYAEPEDDSVTLTTTGYGLDFTSSIEKDNIVACQFHPEKSQEAGLSLLKDFTIMS